MAGKRGRTRTGSGGKGPSGEGPSSGSVRCGGGEPSGPSFEPDGPGTGVALEERIEEAVAPLSRVVCHDDPHTTMEFVVQVFTGVFRLPHPRAIEVMLEVHERGAGVVGHYPRAVAERKVKKATAMARTSGFPLTFSIEED